MWTTGLLEATSVALVVFPSLDTSPNHDEVSNGEFPQGLSHRGVGQLAQNWLGTRLSGYFFSILSALATLTNSLEGSTACQSRTSASEIE